MKTLERNAPRKNPPAYSRVLEAATGEQPWTPAEMAARNHSPQWLIAEAQAHLELSLVETDQVAREQELQATLALIAKLPTTKMQQTCFELLQTYLPAAEQSRFERLFQETCVQTATRSSLRAWQLPALGLVAASLVTLLVVLAQHQEPLAPELTQTEIESHGSIGNTELIRGGDNAIHSDDDFVYEAEVKTSLPQAWLLHFRNVVGSDGKIHIVLRPFENEGGVIRLKDQPPRQALDCLDYYVVIVPQQAQSLDDATHGNWLAQLRTEAINTTGDQLESSQLESIVRRHWQAAGFTGEVKLQTDRFLRHREPRS